MSISSEAGSLARRFMFISLLCSGVGTSLIITGLDLLISHFLLTGLLYPYGAAAPFWLQILLIFGVALLLFRQADSFYGRAMVTPFSIAVADWKFKRDGNGAKPAA